MPAGFGGVGARMTSCCVAGENMDCVSELIADYPLVFNFRFTRGAGCAEPLTLQGERGPLTLLRGGTSI